MTTFSYLKTDLINTTENDSTEFSTQVSSFVKKTEFRLVKDLDDQGMTEYTSVSVSSGNAGAVPLNDRVRIVRNVNYIVSTGTWQAQYDNAILALRNQARRTRQDDMAVAASPAGGPDTITQTAS